jgi:hydroxymethylglutaryl-CoA reductase (NADPH)
MVPVAVPSLLLRKLYTAGSLTNDDGGFHFRLKNRLSDATLTKIVGARVDGSEIPLDSLVLSLGDHGVLRAKDVTADRPAPFGLRQVAEIRALTAPLCQGPHEIQVRVETRPFGSLEISAKDAIPAPGDRDPGLPYDRSGEQDYGAGLIAARRRFVEKFAGTSLRHVAHYSFDPAVTRGNIENFTGVAQIPLGFAGPLRINGEHAAGEFMIPLATSEGSLVASYNRGMKVLNLSGGVTCTVVDDCMQRAPVFIFDSAREARCFRHWIEEHLAEIRHEAEATSHVAKLVYIDTYLAHKFAYLRFNYTTGDAAGQNMVGRATFAACSWIVDHAPGVRRFYLESNFATDKKASYVNLMRTRGKRVTAEAVFPRGVLQEQLRVEPEMLQYHGGVANVGAMLAGATNNGLHSANAITAMFIATGQDVANVAESSAATIYSEVTARGDYYMSITIPSLIVATHGGGTGLPTQRECLEVLGCFGKGKVNKLAEIVAGTVLAGEISLAAAISSLEWVSAHEAYGRKR